MDNQFYQPGGQPMGGYPQGVPGEQPAMPYGMPQAGVQPNPYEQLTPQQPVANYGTVQQPYAAPMGQPNPYEQLNPQQPAVNYGTVQQPYAAPVGQPNPYEQLNPQQPYAAAPMGQPNPYEQLGGMPYAGAAPVGQPNPYEQLNPQQPVVNYGTVQQPYMDPGAMQAPYSENGYQHLFGQGQPGQEQMAAAPVVQPHGQAFAGAAGPAVAQKKRLGASEIAMIVVALLAVIGLSGWWLYANYAPQVAPVGVVATGSLSALHKGSVLVVRNEIPYDAEAVNSILYEAEEGSKVGRNDVICYVYSTGYSASAIRQLQEYRDEIRTHQQELIETSTIYDAKTERYNTELLTLAKEIRAVMSGDDGSMPNIETQLTQVVAERQTHLDQKYASDQRFSRMKDDERSQTQRISSWTLPYKSTTEALVSFYSDGYEYAINGGNYAEFEPDQVRAMINGQKPANAAPGKGKTTIFRLVKDNEWYALFLSNDTEWNPVVGETYELQLERFGDTAVTATVISFTKSGGELLVRLRIVGTVEQVMYLRSCDAVLSESMSTLKVNERAIFTQDGMTGVVIIEGNTESFIPVNVIYTVDGFAYIQTVQQGLIFEGAQVRLF